MSGHVKILKKSKDGKLSYASFFDKLSQVNINPLYRNDFMGDLVSQSEVDPGFGTSSMDETLCEIAVMDNVLNVYYDNGVKPINFVDSSIDFHGTSEDIERLDRHIFQSLRATYFVSALKYWKSRLSTHDFLVFYQKLFPLSQSLPQILHSSEQIVKILLEEIESHESMAREPAYHLLVVLARDLGSEFTRFLPSVFQRLVRLVNSQNLFVLEMTFFSLANLFRLLFSFLLLHLEEYLEFFLPVLAHYHLHVRAFASEALSFLLRRSDFNAFPENLHMLFHICLDDLVNAKFLPTKSTHTTSSTLSHELFKRQENSSAILSDDSSHSPGVCSAAFPKDNNIRVKPPVFSIYIAESLGLTLFNLIKNVNGTFTAKLPVVLEFLSRELLDYIKNALKKSSVQYIKKVYTIFLCTFFIQCRNYTKDWNNTACNALEDMVNNSFQLLLDGNIKKTEEITSRLVLFEILLNTLTSVISCTPRPKNEPVALLKLVWNTLIGSIEDGCQSKCLWNSGILQIVLGPLSTLLICTPNIHDIMILVKRTFGFLDSLTKRVCEEATEPSQMGHLNALITFAHSVHQKMISSKRESSLQLVYHQYSKVLMKMISILPDCQYHSQVVYLTCQFWDLVPSVASIEIASDIEWESCIYRLASICYNQSKLKIEDPIDAEQSFRNDFCYIYLIKRFLCDLHVLNFDSLNNISSRSQFHEWLASQGQYLLTTSKYLSQLTESHEVFDIERISLFLLLGHCFLSISSLLPNRLEFLSLLTTNRFVSNEASVASGIFSWISFQWRCFFRLRQQAPQQINHSFMSLIAEWMTRWLICLMNIFPDIMAKAELRDTLCTLLHCLLLSCSYMSRRTRLDLINCFYNLSEASFSFFYVYPMALDPSTHDVEKVFPSFLPNSSFSYFHRETQDEAELRFFFTAARSLLLNAQRLEVCELSLNQEREKTGCISCLARDIISLWRNFRIISWLHLFALELVISQLSEKFLPLWDAVLLALQELLNNMQEFCLLSDTTSRVVAGAENSLSGFIDLVDSQTNLVYAFLSGTLLHRVASCVQESFHTTKEYSSDSLVGKAEQSHKKHPFVKTSVVNTSLLSVNESTQLYASDTVDFYVRNVLHRGFHNTTDPQTLHMWYCKCLGAILASWFSQNGLKPHNIYLKGVLEWILKSSIMHLHAFSGIYVDYTTLKKYTPFNTLVRPVDELSVRKNFRYGGLGRLLDLLRLVVSFNRDKFVAKENTNGSNCIVEIYDRLSNDCFYRGILVPEPCFQRLCLQLFFSRFPQCNPYRPFLMDVVMDVNLSRTLVNFSIKGEKGLVAKEHRCLVIPLLCRLLVSRLTKRAVKGSKRPKDLAVRRKAIFRFLAQLTACEIPIVLSCIFSGIFLLYSQETGSLLKCEAQKYDHLLLFFTHLNQSTLVSTWMLDFHCVSLQGKQLAWLTPTSNVYLVLHSSGFPRLSYLVSLVSNLEEIVNQLRVAVMKFTPFFFQFCLSLCDLLSCYQDLHQSTYLSNDTPLAHAQTHGAKCVMVEEHFNNAPVSSYVRTLTRRLFKLMTWLMHINPNDVVLFDEALLRYQKFIENALCVSLQSGTISSLVEYIFNIANYPSLFSLFQSSLHSTLFILSEAIASPPILAAVKKGFPTPPLIEAILNFFLRLCRGGYICLEEASKEVRKEEKKYKERRSRSHKKKRLREDSSDPSGCSLSDVNEEENCTLYNDWRTHVNEDCMQGIKVIRPVCKSLLQSFITLLQQRQAALHLVPKRQSLGKALISTHELDCLITFQRYIPDHDMGSISLITHLLDAFPSSRKFSVDPSYVTRQKQLYICLHGQLISMSRVFHTDISTCQTLLQKVKKTCRAHLQFLQDLDLRHTVAKLLLMCALINASCNNVEHVLGEILLSKPSDIKIFLESDTSEILLTKWLPCALVSQQWTQTKNLDMLWETTTSIVLVMLTSLKQNTASMELDDSLCCVLLNEIIQHSLVLKNQEIQSLSSFYFPATHQRCVILQSLFILQTKTIDSSVRLVAQRLPDQVICRVADIAALRESLLNLRHDGEIAHLDYQDEKIQKIQFEWEECQILFHIIFYTIVTAARYMLKSIEIHSLRSALYLLSSLIRHLNPVQCWLPFVTKSTNLFESPSLDAEYKKNQHLFYERFHLDLAQLIHTHSSQTWSPEEGGDLFKELLHIQKHRQSRGVTLLTKSLEMQKITRTTARWIALPIALRALVQQDISEKAAIHHGMSECGLKCLLEIGRLVGWTTCVKLIIRLVKMLQRTHFQHKMITRAICGLISTLEYYINEQVSHYLNECKKQMDMVKKTTPSRLSSVSQLSASDSDTSSSTLEPECGPNSHQEKIVLMQNTVRLKLLPIFRRLSTSGVESSTEEFELKGKQKSSILIHPQFVAAQVQLLKLLPKKQFFHALPHLLELLSKCLRSRDPETRRKGRTSICSTVAFLGPDYIDFICRYLSQSLTKGYQVAVFMFTSTAALMELVFGGGKRGKALRCTPVLIRSGACDRVIPILLPLVAQELCRFCDPGRSEFHYEALKQERLPKQPGIDEERYFKSPELILILSRVASYEAFLTHIFSYLKTLLLGDDYCEVLVSSTSASHRKYHNMVEHLFEQVVLGLYSNEAFTVENKFSIAFRFLHLHSMISKCLASLAASGEKAQQLNDSLDQDSDTEFLSVFISNPADIQTNNETIQPYYKEKCYSVQLGAASGRSLEQVSSQKRPISLSSCGETFALAGLRLLLSLLQSLERNKILPEILKTTSQNIPVSHQKASDAVDESQSEIQRALNSARACSLYCMQCFCGNEDRLLSLSSKVLIKLTSMNCIDVEKEGHRISAVVLRLFQVMGKTEVPTSLIHVRSVASICVRLLAALLTKNADVKWFHRAIKGSNSTNLCTFKSALLTQIYDSLSHAATRIPALQLFRRILQLNKKATILNESENCALIYQCVDEIGALLVQHTHGVQKYINLCGGIYVDFLIDYPMPTRIQRRRIDLLIRNLDYPQYQSRQAILFVLYHLTSRLPVKILIERYAIVLFLGLALRLIKEDHHETRLITRTVIKNILKVVSSEKTISSLFDVIAKAFLYHTQIIYRACFLECLELSVSYIDNPFSTERMIYYLDLATKTLGEALEKKTFLSQQPSQTEFERSDQEWKLPFTFLRFFERFLYLHVDKMHLCLEEKAISTRFLPLWQYMLYYCSMHPHPWIKLTTLRIITYLLTQLCDGDKVSIALLFSSKYLIYLTTLNKKQDDQHVLPLTALLWHYINWVQESHTEELGNFCELFIRGITSVCKGLLYMSSFNSIQNCTISSLQRFCAKRSRHSVTDVIPSEEKNAKATDFHSVEKYQCRKFLPEEEFSLGDTKNVPGDTTSLNSSPKHSAKISLNANSNTNAIVLLTQHPSDVISDKNKDYNVYKGYLSEQMNIIQASDEDNLETKEASAFASEQLLDHLVLETVEDLSGCLHHACQELESHVMPCDTDASPLSSAISTPNLFQFIKASRIRWTIGKLMWLIKRGAGQLNDFIVRICIALSILKNILYILPCHLFHEIEGRHLLNCILEAIYTCSSLLRRVHSLSLPKENCINYIAVARQTSLKTYPKALTGVVAYFATNIMDQVENFMESKNMSTLFFQSLHKVQKMVGSRRLRRKQEAKRLKVKHPQKAALKKILRHEKKKRMKKNRATSREI